MTLVVLTDDLADLDPRVFEVPVGDIFSKSVQELRYDGQLVKRSPTRVCTIGVAGVCKRMYFPSNLYCPVPEKLERREQLGVSVVRICYLVAEFGTRGDQLFECVERVPPSTA